MLRKINGFMARIKSIIPKPKKDLSKRIKGKLIGKISEISGVGFAVITCPTESTPSTSMLFEYPEGSILSTGLFPV